MDLNSLYIIVALIGALFTLSEWRIRMLHMQFREKVEDVDKVNKVIQANLETKIERLETKIDMLIDLNLRQAYDKK